MTIYYTNIDAFTDEILLEDLLKQLPQSMHARAKRYKSTADAHAYVLGRLLLKRGLTDLNLVNDFGQLQLNENGKPILEHCFFNISHSNGLIVCAISNDCEVGIDVEKMNSVDLSSFEDWFTKMEWEDIHDAENSLHRFYWYWTKKESIIKALGMKLSDMNKLRLEKNQDSFIEKEKKWYLQKLDFGKGYEGHLCSSGKNEIEYILLKNFNSLK